MNDELESEWKGGDIAYFKVLSEHLSGGTEQETRKPRVSRPQSRPV